MPDDDVTITVEYEQVYTVTVNNSGDGGTVKVSPKDKDLKPGDTVTLTLEPNEGYALDTISATYGTGTSLELEGEGNTRTFVMPAGDVTVTVSFKQRQKYTVNISSSITNGSIIPNPKEAYEGETVTLNISPARGYELKSIYIYVNERSEVNFDRSGISLITFIMPASNVTVNATFEQADFITNLRVGTLYDAPSVNSFAYTGKYKYDNSDADSQHRMVENYSLSEPEIINKGTADEYVKYTFTAQNLHMFARVKPSEAEPNPESPTFGYYLGLVMEPADIIWYNTRMVTLKVSDGDGVMVTSSCIGLNTNYNYQDKSAYKDANNTFYFEVDPTKPNREYWFEVTWGNSSNTGRKKTEKICIVLDGGGVPITHNFKVPTGENGGFVGENISMTSYGTGVVEKTEDGSAQVGFVNVASPDALGWTIPTSWKWYWLMDGETKIEPGQSLADLTSTDFGDNYGQLISFYDHDFQLVIEEIPKFTVTVGECTNGTITLSPQKATNEYNSGETVTVTVKPNSGCDVSSLTVGDENVSALMNNGEYSFAVTDNVTVSAKCTEADDVVTSVRVAGYTASHTGVREWSITLPYGSVLPGETDGNGITITTKNGATATFQEATGEGTKTYKFKIGENDYTVKVTIAEQRTFTVTVNADNGLTTNGIETISEKETLNLELIPGFGYALPDNITVSVRKVILKSSEYSYNKTTGKLTIAGGKITGDVEVTVRTVYGTVPVTIKSNNGDIYVVGYDFVKQENTQTNNPDYNTALPRTGSSDNAIATYNLPADAKMVPTDSQQIEGTDPGDGEEGDGHGFDGSEGNPFQWVIPKWLTFDGWYVNQDASGNHVEDTNSYTKLNKHTDGTYPFTPNKNNPEPIIEARWKVADTYSLTVTLMPGADDVVYDGPVDDPPPADLWHQTVTAENAMTVTAKAVLDEELSLYIPKTYYVRDNYHFSRWVDESGDPIEMGEDGAITVKYDAETEDKDLEMVIYADWVQDSTDYEITAVFMPGDHGTGGPYTHSLYYNQDVSGNYNPTVLALPDANECGIEPDEGWKFTGWKIEGDNSGQLYNTSVTTSEFVAEYPNGVTFIAQWEAIPLVDIHYTVSPGSGNEVTGGDSAQVLSKDSQVRTVTLPTTKAEIASTFGWNIPENVEFLNWTFGTDFIVNEEAGAGQTEAFRPTEGMTITATWTTKNNVDTWQLEFDANGGDEADGNDMPTLIHRVEKNNENAEWTVEVGECNFEAPEGMQFSYWTINGKQVSPNSIYTIKQSDIRDGKITVKAVWKNIPDTVVKVYFRGGGGTGSMSSDEVKIAWNETSKTYTFPSCDYVGTSVNPTFAGWKYTVKGARDGKPFSESDGKIYQPGTVITVKAPSSNETITSIELVAQWKPRTGGGYVPNPGIGGGTGAGTGGAGTAVGKNPVNTQEPDRQPGNGKVDSNVHSANTGETVTVLPTPDSRYMTGKVTVLDKDGNEVDVTWNGDGTYSFKMPEGGVTVTAEFVTPDEVYNDVEADDWYLADVANAANYGLMTGVSATDFGPDETATRAQMMTILARRNNVPGTWAGGADWYKAGAEWAVYEGISDGTRLFDALTREEIITMLYRYVGSPKVSGSRTAAFADANEVDSWAVDAIEWAVEVGIMQGRGNNELAPRDVATRAELAAILSRVMRLVKEF